MLRPFYREHGLEAGCDEAGRGCLAGPVFAAAVILPPDFSHPLLDDSKKMTARARRTVREEIERHAVAWKVAMVDERRIDGINILRASFEAMSLAVEGLGVRPELLLIDGNRFRSEPGIPHVCVVGGDALYASIAAASVLAKTHRDDYMEALHVRYPAYGWDRNKGYPTREHRLALLEHGPTPHHRLTFGPLADPELRFPPETAEWK